jgi:3-oxoacyl-[acyl-carrier-protein] synthase-1
MGSLAITALGAVSSVGVGVVQSCAAIRAGLSRPRPVTHFEILDEDRQAPAPLRGHPIHGLTDGFAPNARWLLMSRRALADLEVALGPTDAAFWSRCAVAFVLPVLADARFYDVPTARPDTIWASCLDVVIAERGLSTNPRHRALLAIGAGGIGSAFERAAGWLDQREVDRVLVVAADSLLDGWSLGWLSGGRRLKDGANPVGLAPGEAAVALLLEPPPGRGVGRAPLATVTAAAFEEADEPFQNVSRRQGRAAQAALTRALQAAGPSLAGDLYVNLNGEDWRAAELGGALSGIPVGLRGVYRVLTPATSVGDVGAAAGALQIACAVRSYARGYASGPQSWILATSDYGDASVISVKAA